jgi:hypothetical protein
MAHVKDELLDIQVLRRFRIQCFKPWGMAERIDKQFFQKSLLFQKSPGLSVDLFYSMDKLDHFGRAGIQLWYFVESPEGDSSGKHQAIVAAIIYFQAAESFVGSGHELLQEAGKAGGFAVDEMFYVGPGNYILVIFFGYRSGTHSYRIRGNDRSDVDRAGDRFGKIFRKNRRADFE